MDFSRLRELLSKEQFPLEYLFKFVGNLDSTFEDGVRDFETRYPQLRRVSRRESEGGRHVAMTYSTQVANPDQVILILGDIHKLPGIRIVL